ncbi:hypothetical protein LRS05_08950 [Flavobacterium sp. J372]|uniref:hypothetical protein n=1 Tax=Flavobacterium sp. J372 TaxID=2898436 RepID=UPI002151C117|nr:hypothetical protein [Flavobacterium sp. J372]MCR5862265.1 hypothetical protein [Flavobacterium sp. J372]
MTEAGNKVTKQEIDNLKQSLRDNNLWEISRMGAQVTFFLYTEEQVKQYEKSTVRKEWKNKYFDLLDPYNEFGYLSRDTFEINIDSKENFDNNFQSTWYYYYH